MDRIDSSEYVARVWASPYNANHGVYPNRVMKVFVLLFNAGTDSEGIHTLKKGDENTVLMFEHEDDAIRFGVLLEAQDFPPLTVEALDDEEIKGFCQGAGYSYKVVTSEDLVIPPDANVSEEEWELGNKESDAPRAQDTEISDDELERLRKRFEKLL